MGPTLGERQGGGKKKKANQLKALHSGSARPPSSSPSPPHPVICHSQGYFMLIYRVRGWELLRDCVVGRRGKKGGQKLENRGGERGPVFVAFGRAALQFSHQPARCGAEETNTLSRQIRSNHSISNLAWSLTYRDREEEKEVLHHRCIFGRRMQSTLSRDYQTHEWQSIFISIQFLANKNRRTSYVFTTVQQRIYKKIIPFQMTKNSLGHTKVGQ